MEQGPFIRVSRVDVDVVCCAIKIKFCLAKRHQTCDMLFLVVRNQFSHTAAKL